MNHTTMSTEKLCESYERENTMGEILTNRPTLSRTQAGDPDQGWVGPVALRV